LPVETIKTFADRKSKTRFELYSKPLQLENTIRKTSMEIEIMRHILREIIFSANKLQTTNK
nr:hypothetical protein [Tenuifilaceae bacterium]